MSYIRLLFPFISRPVSNMCLDARPITDELISAADEAARVLLPESRLTPDDAASTAFTFSFTTGPRLRRAPEREGGVPEGGDMFGGGRGGAAPPEAAAPTPYAYAAPPPRSARPTSAALD